MLAIMLNYRFIEVYVVKYLIRLDNRRPHSDVMNHLFYANGNDIKVQLHRRYIAGASFGIALWRSGTEVVIFLKRIGSKKFLARSRPSRIVFNRVVPTIICPERSLNRL